VLDSLGIARAALVGNSLGAHEASHFALTWPDRVTRIVNLDHPFHVEDLRPVLARIPPWPSASDADRASVAAYRDYVARVFGFRPPEAEIRGQFHVLTDGRVGQAVAPGRIPRTISEGMRPLPLEDLRVPILAFANRFRGFLWFDELDAAGRARADSVMPSVVQAFSQAWERYARRTRARMVDLPQSTHHAYISNAQEVFEAMSAFLLAPTDTSRMEAPTLLRLRPPIVSITSC
jgi:pimeloyl-ACP methyl ester carboxylesterase